MNITIEEAKKMIEKSQENWKKMMELKKSKEVDSNLSATWSNRRMGF